MNMCYYHWIYKRYRFLILRCCSDSRQTTCANAYHQNIDTRLLIHKSVWFHKMLVICIYLFESSSSFSFVSFDMFEWISSLNVESSIFLRLIELFIKTFSSSSIKIDDEVLFIFWSCQLVIHNQECKKHTLFIIDRFQSELYDVLISNLTHKQRRLEMFICHDRLRLLVITSMNEEFHFQIHILFQYLTSSF
jgi:hypothetical protein